ncbi:cupin domain-containing protein [Salinisphaera sp. Q1T1-3]|nr:cupin domain-containing protein [Salinisphaera sp. Q1T1-3]
MASQAADQNTDASQGDSNTLRISHAADRDTRADLSKYFTGKALVNPLFSAEDDSHATAASVTFEPGARTNWHTHPVGQQLVVTDGIGWVQMKGQPKQTIKAGDVVWIPAGVKHWHGATANHSMTHIAVQERRDGDNVSWDGPVTDAQYNAE